MSQRRRSLEQQYLFTLDQKEKKQPSNPLLKKECSFCGSKAMACFSDDGGKNWYCYGHRPDATRKERDEQTIETKRVEENIRQRLAKRERGTVDTVENLPQSVYRRRPKPIQDEEDLSWAI